MTPVERRRHARHAGAVVASFVHELSEDQRLGVRSSRARRSCREGRRTISHHSTPQVTKPITIAVMPRIASAPF